MLKEAIFVVVSVGFIAFLFTPSSDEPVQERAPVETEEPVATISPSEDRESADSDSDNSDSYWSDEDPAEQDDFAYGQPMLNPNPVTPNDREAEPSENEIRLSDRSNRSGMEAEDLGNLNDGTEE